MAAAVHARHTVRIEHTRGVREVDPCGLVVHARRWYLAGRDHLRAAIRMYRLDRISGATRGSSTPPIRPGTASSAPATRCPPHARQ
ncbi:WYL domain-containing protein [Nonomuraea sp. NPDC049028]|uniref:WYL domain-containing protein n=1 Tax=Nonomuraea sp. NPDC049028 TaxID=3364348 RepID=UPI00371B1601